MYAVYIIIHVRRDTHIYIYISQTIYIPCRSGTTRLKVPNGDRGGQDHHPTKTILLHFVKCQGATNPSTFFWITVICFILVMAKTLLLPLSYSYAIWITLGHLPANWTISWQRHMSLLVCGVTQIVALHRLTSSQSNRSACQGAWDPTWLYRLHAIIFVR